MIYGRVGAEGRDAVIDVFIKVVPKNKLAVELLVKIGGKVLNEVIQVIMIWHVHACLTHFFIGFDLVCITVEHCLLTLCQIKLHTNLTLEPCSLEYFVRSSTFTVIRGIPVSYHLFTSAGKFLFLLFFLAHLWTIFWWTILYDITHRSVLSFCRYS